MACRVRFGRGLRSGSRGSRRALGDDRLRLGACLELLDARRELAQPLVKLLERLLGLDLKLRQYEVGKRFCDAVVRDWGIESLNRAWAAPELLPALAELDDPAEWVRRTQVRSVTSGS